MKRFFTVLAGIHSEDGGIDALRVMFFDKPGEEDTDNKSRRRRVKYEYYPFSEENDMPDLSQNCTVEDIPVWELRKILGASNVLMTDYYYTGSPYLHHAIECNITRIGDMNIGTIKVAHCGAIANVKADGTVEKEIFQIIGKRGMFRRKPRSRAIISKYPDNEEVYLVDHTGKAVKQNVNKLKESAPEHIWDNPFMNITRNGEFPSAFDTVIIGADEKYGVGYNEIVSDLIMSLGRDCINSKDVPFFESYRMVSLPEKADIFIAPQKLCIPIDIYSVDENNKCRTVVMPRKTISTVRLMSGNNSQKYSINAQGYGHYNSFGGMMFGPGLMAGGNVSFDLVSLPDVAAGGVIIEADSIADLRFPEQCAEIFNLKLKECNMEEIDLTKYDQALQHFEIGSSRSLRTVKLGGIGSCCFYATDLEQLESISIQAEMLSHATIDLRGLGQPKVRIYIDSDFDSSFGWYPPDPADGYPHTDVDIIIAASELSEIELVRRKNTKIGLTLNGGTANIRQVII